MSYQNRLWLPRFGYIRCSSVLEIEMTSSNQPFIFLHNSSASIALMATSEMRLHLNAAEALLT